MVYSLHDFQVKAVFFNEDGKIPNNPKLPLLYYPMVLDEDDSIMEIFERNNWRNSWTGSVLPYHHYHSNSHEVLGVQKGTAAIMFGGEHGEEMHVKRGDVVILPAGCGHKKLKASTDFEVVGAYPDGKDYDMKTQKDPVSQEVWNNIKDVKLPKADPVFGKDGPLIERWHQD
ncbi:cupin domain-containing protein [Bacillus sp. FJAT-44742]|uniref:cupin domain-containing protein n=1 Tax=Bacillus sp. FJAT-44742 TaxID=2014005 RepID=UPI001E34CB35|nr:cupin domain-containing protein [Bacillus sp. FJAT-44742]